MSLFQRISATLTSTLDRAVARVENHDAIIETALRDTRRAAARSRVRLERVRRDGASLRSRHRELELAAGRWAERAKRVAGEDEGRALECLRRRRACTAQLASLAASIEQHEELEGRMDAQVKKIEARLHEVTHQRNMMRSRQSVAEAMDTLHNLRGMTVGDIEDTFDRWEIHLGETEVLSGAATAVDPLDAAFRDEEEDAVLREELDELRGADGGADGERSS